MLADLAGVGFLQRFGKVVVEQLLHERLVWHLAGQQVVQQRDLGVAEQHGQLRSHQPGGRPSPLHEVGVGRQGFQRAVEQSAVLEMAHQASM
ncbi:MAG: hypothetical protein HC861_07965 [Rhodospirillaceae bacterium]|nr:hypothetical protein [Rhodospirillaceae bacterium]